MVDGNMQCGRIAKAAYQDPADRSLFEGMGQFPLRKDFDEWLENAPKVLEVSYLSYSHTWSGMLIPACRPENDLLLSQGRTFRRE